MSWEASQKEALKALIGYKISDFELHETMGRDTSGDVLELTLVKGKERKMLTLVSSGEYSALSIYVEEVVG